MRTLAYRYICAALFAFIVCVALGAPHALAATWLGDQQGAPPSYTGDTWPDQPTCWANYSYYSYGTAYTPLCWRDPTGSNAGDFYSEVFSAHPAGSAAGLTYWVSTHYNYDTAGQEAPVDYVGEGTYEGTDDSGYAYYSCFKYAVPPGDDYVQSDGRGGTACYGYRAQPAGFSNSIGGAGGAPSVPYGGQLTLEWSCFPGYRTVNYEFHDSGGTFSSGSWHAGTLYQVYVASGGYTLGGPGWNPGGALVGSQTITANGGPWLYYTFQCLGGSYGLPALTIPVYVEPPTGVSLSLTASPSTVDWQTGTTLNWSASGGGQIQACYLGGGQWGGGTPVGASGQTGTSPLTQDTQYYFWCQDAYYGTVGPVYATVHLGVSSATNITVSASPSTIRQGLDQTTVTATANSVSSCTLSTQDGTVLKNYSGPTVNDHFSWSPSVTSTLSLDCRGDNGYRSHPPAQTTVNVTPAPILSLTGNNTPVQVTIPPNTSADIRWTSKNVLPGSCTVTYTAAGGTCLATGRSLATKGAYNMKAFTIGANTYLAVANAYDGSTYALNSPIYKWSAASGCFGDGTTCGTPMQQLATQGAAKWETLVRGGVTYLMVANSRNDSTRAVNSNIYQWMSGSNCFGSGASCGVPYQSLATKGAVDMRPLVVGSDTYLAVANYRDDGSYQINSYIYKWTPAGAGCPASGGWGDGSACGSVFETIPTQGAYRMDAFTFSGGSYFAFSNATKDGNTTFNVPSNLYQFISSGTNCPAGGGFGSLALRKCGVPAQSINTSGAYDFKFFTIGSQSYLAVANSYDGTSFNINSKIYQWMPGSACFGDGTTCGAALQQIATSGATELTVLYTGSTVPYLIAANAYNGNTYNLNSAIYQWMAPQNCFGNGAACGVAMQVIPTSGAAWVEPMTINNTQYLGFADYYSGTSRTINSLVMQWAPNGCGDTQFGTPTTWHQDNSPPGGYPTGVFSGARFYTMTCRWTDNSVASSTNLSVAVLAQLILSANGSTTPTVYITPGTIANIQWSTQNVQQGSCTVTNSQDSTIWYADSNTVGYPSPLLTEGQSISYTLACTNLLGQPVSQAMTVIAAAQVPSISNGDLTITASRALKGARPTITWHARNLKAGLSCTITPALAGGAAASQWDGTGTTWDSAPGGALGPTINIATTFTLACTNKAGDTASVSATATLIPSFKEL